MIERRFVLAELLEKCSYSPPFLEACKNLGNPSTASSRVAEIGGGAHSIGGIFPTASASKMSRPGELDRHPPARSLSE